MDNNNNYLYHAYETYIESFGIQFGIAVTPPTFEEYIKFHTGNRQPFEARTGFNPLSGTGKNTTWNIYKAKRKQWGEKQARVLVVT